MGFSEERTYEEGALVERAFAVFCNRAFDHFFDFSTSHGATTFIDLWALDAAFPRRSHGGDRQSPDRGRVRRDRSGGLPKQLWQRDGIYWWGISHEEVDVPEEVVD